MANPGDLSSKKVKNTYKRIVQYDGQDHEIYDGTGSRIVDLNVTRITASNASLANIQDLQHLTVSRVQVDTHLSVSGSTFLGNNCGDDQLKVHANAWVSGALTVSGSCQGSFRSIGQAKFIYLQNPGIEDQKPARVNRGQDGTGGYYNVPRFGGENAALDVYGNVVITGSLIVEDTIFAQEFHTEIVSESIIFTSGSTKFGAQFDDTMLVTGSIMQSGSDSYFLNGVGIGTSGSQLQGTFIQPGQATPPIFSHLLRIDDQGHDGLGWKNGKVMYATYTTPAEDNFRFRDKTQSDDVFVVNGNTLSVFFTTEDKYNVGIAVPSGSTIDENLVVSSSTNSRTKIESATAATSASLFFESGKTAWEITTVSASTGTNNQMSGSLVFRTQNMLNNLNTNPWVANSTYTEALRLDKTGKVGFNIPSINAYQYPQQIQLSGSLNIIQGRTIDINAGTFHDKDGINGIYFNNQKMIYVSGSGADTSMFFGVSAGGTDAATGGEANIGFGYQSAMAMTTGDYNTLVGYNTGKALTTGGANVFIGKQAGLKTLDGQSNIGIGTSAFYNSTGTANYTIAIGYEAMKTGVATGEDNIAIGRVSLEDVTSGHHNISIGHKASLNLTTADNNIAIGEDALGIGIVTGDKNIAIGTDAGQDMTTGTSNVLMGTTAGSSLLAGSFNVALGFGALDASEAASNQVAIGSNAMGTGVVTGATNVAIGANALLDITSGARNVALGTGTAEELTSGFDNVAIGTSAMGTGIVTGYFNIALGKIALEDITSGTDNIALGRLAAGNLTTGISNIAVGSGSMGLGTVTGNDNISIGNFALEDLTSGINNIAIGSGSAASVTTNRSNIAIGYQSFATSADDGDKNIAIGYKAMSLGDVAGDNNIGIGGQTLQDLTSGINNIAVGPSAASNLTTGGQNVFIGNSTAGTGIVTGDKNIGFGTEALAVLTSGAENIAIGSSALTAAAETVANVAVGTEALSGQIGGGSYNTAIGPYAMRAANGNFSSNIAIGHRVGLEFTTAKSNIAIGSGSMAMASNSSHDNIAIGNFALEDNTTGGNNIAIGSGSMKEATNNIGNVALGWEAMRDSVDDGHWNVAIGYQAMYNGDTSGDDNIAIGREAGSSLTTGAANILLGKSSGDAITDGFRNILLGREAGTDIDSGTYNIGMGTSVMSDLTDGVNNIALGTLALGKAAGGTVQRNIAVGHHALAFGIVTGDDNIALGSQTGLNLTSGQRNIAIGSGSMGVGVVTGDDNIALGRDALGDLTSGDYNVVLGNRAGTNLTTGNLNIFVGQAANTGVVTGDGNVAIGNNVAPNITSGEYNVVLGADAAPSLTTGRRNFVAGFDAANRLVKGDYNIAIGEGALAREMNLDANIAIGFQAGLNSTGSANIFIGSGSDAPTHIDGTAAINNSIALGNHSIVSASNSMVIGNGTAGFKTALGRIYTPNSTLEVSGSVRITGSLTVSSSNTTTIKGNMFVGEENPTTDWTMAHYQDDDTKWVVGNDRMEFHVGGEQFIRILEDDSQDMITFGDTGDIDFIVSSGATNALFVEGSSARVGIGTADPKALLDVQGDISGSGTLRMDGGAIFGDDVAVMEAFSVEGATSTNGTNTFGNAVSDFTLFNGNITGSSNLEIAGNISSSTTSTGSFGYLNLHSTIDYSELIKLETGNRKYAFAESNLDNGSFAALKISRILGTKDITILNMSGEGQSGSLSIGGEGMVHSGRGIPLNIDSAMVVNEQPAVTIAAQNTGLTMGVNRGGTNPIFTANEAWFSTGTHLQGDGSTQAITFRVGGLDSGSRKFSVIGNGNISASGTAFTNGLYATGDITSSGIARADEGFVSNGDNILLYQNVQNPVIIRGTADGRETFFFGDGTTPNATRIVGSDIHLSANVTASGNVSASGTVQATHFISDLNSIAATGNSAGDGEAIPSTGITLVSAADGTKAAVLPAASSLTLGHTITIHNTDTGNALKVFPTSGDTINPLSQDSAATLPAKTAMVVTVTAEDAYHGYFTTIIS